MKGSSMQWSFSNMASPHVSFKSAQEQRAGPPHHRSYPPHFPQGISSHHHWHQNDLPPMNHHSDGRVFPGTGQATQTMYHLPGNASNLRTSTMGGASVGPTVKVSPPNGPVVGSTELRSSPSISTGPCQLTIFYNGSVCVYDNVSPDKAQAIMLLAGNGDSAKPKTIPIPLSSAPKVQPPVSHMPPTDHHIVTQTPMPMPKLPQSPPPLLRNLTNDTGTANLAQSNDSLIENEQSLSVRLPGNDTSISNQGVRLTSSISPITQSPLVASTSGSELTSVKPVVASVQPNFPDPYKPDTSVGAAGPKSAVPQARKASLARFLEKRKERVIDVSPYPANKTTYECDSIGFRPTFITNTAISKKQLDTIESRT